MVTQRRLRRLYRLFILSIFLNLILLTFLTVKVFAWHNPIVINPGVNYTNQFKADNQFFINDMRRMAADRELKALEQDRARREWEREMLEPKHRIRY